MEEKRNHIDEFMKQSLDGFEPEPSEKVWKVIKGKLAWKEFMRFNFTNFTSNIYQISAAILIGAGIITGLVTQILLVDKIHHEIFIPLVVNDSTAQPPSDSSPTPLKPVDSLKITTNEPQQNLLPTYSTFLPASLPISTTNKEIEEIPSTESFDIQLSSLPISHLLSNHKAHISIKSDLLNLYPLSSITKDSVAYGPMEPIKYPYQLSLEAGWWFNWMTLPYTNEDFSYYWNALGMAFKVEYRKLYAKTGLNFSRLFDRLPYDLSYKSYDSTGFVYNVHYYVPDPTHPDHIILITSKETLYDSIAHTQNIFTTGTYNYLNIPVQFGYQFLKTRGFTFDVYAGCGLQFLISKKEPYPAIYNYLKAGLHLTPAVIEHYDFNYFFFGGLNIQYSLTPMLKLELEPVYQYYMKPLGDQKEAGNPFSWGIKVGINYDF